MEFHTKFIYQKGAVISSAVVTFHKQIENEDILQQRMSEQVVNQPNVGDRVRYKPI